MADSTTAAHWAEAYVGIPWTRRHNCAWLARDVMFERFGQVITLPRVIDWRRASFQEVESLADDVAIRVTDPREGDAVLMRVRGNRTSPGGHVGVYCEWNGEPWVLHSVEGMGCLFQPVASLSLLQLEVVSYYRWL